MRSHYVADHEILQPLPTPRERAQAAFDAHMLWGSQASPAMLASDRRTWADAIEKALVEQERDMRAQLEREHAARYADCEARTIENLASVLMRMAGERRAAATDARTTNWRASERGE